LNRLKLFVITLFAINILLVGLEASKAPPDPAPGLEAGRTSRDTLPGITLLSEMTALDSGSLSRQCFTVGPFETRPTVEAITEMLREYTSQVSPRETEAFVDRGYWVYLPPFENEIAARQAVNVLYDEGIDDVGLIRDGEFNHSVSLGYFINQSNAKQHRDRIRAMGYQAEFRIQRDDESRFWVDYEQQTGVEYASRVLAGFVPEELHRPTLCPEFSDGPAIEAGTS
jgi:hypothetical protein